MTFDVAIGVNQGELNSASQSVYTALYPRLFKGSTTAQYQGSSFTIDFDVQAAPVFDLSASQDASALQARWRARAEEEGRDLGELEAVLPALADAAATFAVNFPAVALTLTGPTSTQLTLGLTALCNVEVSGSTVSFAPYQVTAAAQSDPVTNWLVQHVVVPQILTMAQTLLSGITIPPISVAGVSLSPPSVGIVDGLVIAAANANAGSPPSPDGSTPWPNAAFFALLSPNIVQILVAQEMASASNQYSNSGGGGDSWAGYDWSYGLSLTNPQIDIQGDGSIAMTFSLSGSVSGSVEVVYVTLGLDFNANAEPDPSIVAGVQPNGGALDIVTQSVNPFTIIVTPGGSIPDWVLGWLISAIIDAVVTSVTPLITQFLGGINLTSLEIPTYSVTVEGTALSLTPENLQTGNFDGNLVIAGDLAVTG